MKNRVVTITGPSCAGKSTLEKMLKKRGFASVISHTTRKPRVGEVHGREYYFLSKEEFIQRKDRGEFIEVVSFNGNLYGSSFAEFNRCFADGKPVVIVCEPHGKDQIQQAGETYGWKVYSVFVDGPLQTLMTRWADRLRREVLATSVSEHQRIIEQFGRRLAHAIEEESEWRHPENRTMRYSLDILRFDEANEGLIVEQICSFVGLGIEDIALGSM